MKYHRHLVDQLIRALQETEDYPADKIVQYHLKKNKKWGSRDRRFFAENFYQCVRWKRLLEKICIQGIQPAELSQWVALLIIHNRVLPEFVSVSEAQRRQVEEAYKLVKEDRAIREAIPDWLDKMGSAQLGERWDFLLPILNQEAPVFLRPNLLKTSLDELSGSLTEEGLLLEPEEGALKLKKRANVFRTDSFKAGHFEVQDLHSQKVAPFLAPQPGERVIDACAGAGGKTLHLGQLMENRGKIVALDIHQWKLKELQKRAARAGLDIVESRKISGSKTIKRLKESADRLLLDVPCSGMGVLRRNPDSKWRMTEPQCLHLLEVQKEILQQYTQMLKPGGTLVYATCSVFPDENRKQIESFLAGNSEFREEEELSLDPIVDGGDGFYMCRLRRS